MIGSIVVPAVVALMAGLVVSVLFFVPFVAMSYRRRGSLGAGHVLLWLGAAIYFWAIWTYTLLPLPEYDTYTCKGLDLDPLGFWPVISKALATGGNIFRAHGVAQLVLNVALFVPLGFFIRVLGGRGVAVALVTGLGVSALVEVTQITGVWGLYPCPYRVFDVVDLETNTLGAVIGSLAALLVPGAWRCSGPSPDADRPRPVTRGRRLLALTCDVLAAGLLGGSVTVAATLALSYLPDGDDPGIHDGSWAFLIGALTPTLAWLILIWVTGQSVGDLSVRLRYRGALPEPLARTLRALGGVPGYLLLEIFDTGIQPLFAVLALIAVLATRDGRGLPGLLSGQRLTDARETPPRAFSAPPLP